MRQIFSSLLFLLLLGVVAACSKKDPAPPSLQDRWQEYASQTTFYNPDGTYYSSEDRSTTSAIYDITATTITQTYTTYFLEYTYTRASDTLTLTPTHVLSGGTRTRVILQLSDTDLVLQSGHEPSIIGFSTIGTKVTTYYMHRQ